MEEFVIIDGHSFIYRAYYASAYSKPLMTSKGIKTNGIFLFIKMIESLIKKIKPKYLLVALDSPVKTNKAVDFKDYKSTRKPMPLDLVQQMPYFIKFLEARGIKALNFNGFEADDIIASIVKKFSDKDFRIKIYSSDRDLLQLINKNTSICFSKKGVSDIEEVNINNFEEKYQIKHSQFLDYKCILGDKSDNIPGIKGIGEKQAIKLLKTYDSLEELITLVREGKCNDEKLVKLISGYEHDLNQIKRIVTVIDNLEINEPIDNFIFDEIVNTAELSKLYSELEFNSLNYEK